MSLTLQPQKNFTVVRQIANHTDSATYYVQAVIRNAYTDDIIDTLQLTDKGGQRFKKDWRVPADPSGEGFFISIVTSVYTDSGYTTKSDNYGDEETTYLVIDRLRSGGGGSGVINTGGGKLSAADVRRIMREELGKIEEKPEKHEKAPETPVERPEIPMRWDEVIVAIKELGEAIKGIKQPDLDLSPVLSSIKSIENAIADKEVTPPTDLNPILDRINEFKESDDVDMQEIRDLFNTNNEVMVKVIAHVINTEFGKKEFRAEIVAKAHDVKEKEAKPEKKKIDIKNLGK